MFGVTGDVGDLHNSVIQAQVCKGLHVSNTRTLVAETFIRAFFMSAHLRQIQQRAGSDDGTVMRLLDMLKFGGASQDFAFGQRGPAGP